MVWGCSHRTCSSNCPDAARSNTLFRHCSTISPPSHISPIIYHIPPTVLTGPAALLFSIFPALVSPFPLSLLLCGICVASGYLRIGLLKELTNVRPCFPFRCVLFVSLPCHRNPFFPFGGNSPFLRFGLNLPLFRFPLFALFHTPSAPFY